MSGLEIAYLGLLIGSLAATTASTVVSVQNANRQAEFQHDQAKKQAERAQQAVEANTRAAARAARRQTARLQAAAAGDIFGPTLEARQSQAVRDALTEARNRNFTIGQRSSDAIAGMQFREQTARMAALNAGLQGSAAILSTASRGAGNLSFGGPSAGPDLAAPSEFQAYSAPPRLDVPNF